ncbi:cytochrome P450 89A2-like [Phoenix dactylifera]|uniref:Cytochrome P450 89A2-like n=1 Tax=Phoenix dactylifera TaxID=42345 RepID=A0A8B7CKA8_PHODC|nr:cytochrome P450 89A2-like [Phoenix dactylifera]
METWLLVFLSLSLCVVVNLLLNQKHKKRLPPGPPAVPILGNLLWLRRSFTDLEPLLRDLHARYGPIVTLRIGSRLSIFISDRHLAHKALVENGAAFADRPAPLPATRFISCDQHNITSAPYGSLWRLLRRNLMSETLHNSRVKLFAPARQWVLHVLAAKLHAHGTEKSGAAVMESFQFAMFCLLALMCFGEKLDEESVRAIEAAQRDLLLYGRQLGIFNFVPAISKHLFRNRWSKAMEMRQRQKEIYLPLIRARREHKLKKKETEERFVHSYLDSLLDIELPEEENRNLTEDEIIVLCSEFLNAGTDTTSTALQWIMAELVKHQEVQAKLLEEIEDVVGKEDEEVKEEDLQRMPYNKAVVMEGLRRHPPGHFVLPHAVTEEMTIEGYTIPKDAVVNFLVAEMGRDEEVWEEPLEFKPERFLDGGAGEGVDITGTREIKMMPFGVGRRICPGLGLAMLHLEYFVANLVREFEWKSVEGKEVDLAEKPEFTVVMKNPLRARVIPRRNACN